MNPYVNAIWHVLNCISQSSNEFLDKFIPSTSDSVEVMIASLTVIDTQFYLQSEAQIHSKKTYNSDQFYEVWCGLVQTIH